MGLFSIQSPHWRPCVALLAWSTTKGVEIQGICIKSPLFRVCPNCGTQIHVRKLACLCGHVFRGSKPLTTRNASRRSDVSAARALETEQQTAKCRKSDREHVRETRALETATRHVQRLFTMQGKGWTDDTTTWQMHKGWLWYGSALRSLYWSNNSQTTTYDFMEKPTAGHPYKA